jgi:hypothetical protein
VAAWIGWAESLDRVCRGYTRPAGAYAMTTDAELCFLENYARYSYTGQGRIIDLGCWLGATSLCLARGLADNAQHRQPHPIEAIDRFIWESWMDPIAQASRAEESHPRALPEPYVSLSAHTAPSVRP